MCVFASFVVIVAVLTCLHKNERNILNSISRNQSCLQYGNIMYDRRIVRGNTYAQHTLPAVSVISVGMVGDAMC